MGIFSLFKRKNTLTGSPAGPETVRLQRAADGAQPAASEGAERLSTQARQRDLARATAMKIDAIESAMTLDIFNGAEPARSRVKHARVEPPADQDGAIPTLLDLQTTQLLNDDDVPDPAANAQTASVIEEIAILFANNQVELARHMLVASLEDIGQTDRSVWWMLFDLYQISAQQEAFDNLSIDYASRFEVSPPAWVVSEPVAVAEKTVSGLAPTEVFSGILDQRVAPQLERMHQLANNHQGLRVDFSRITQVDPDGCALLLAELTRLRGQQRELSLVGGSQLAGQIRTIIGLGQRESTEAPWLLLLELLQLMNKETDFEEASMDYCVTFEVSPPSFVAPKLTAASRQAAPALSDHFLLPPVVPSACAPLLDAIAAHAQQHQLVALDCSQLARVDFGAAGDLLQRLRPLAEAGKKIEFRHMNHLIAALFNLIGFQAVATIFPNKY